MTGTSGGYWCAFKGAYRGDFPKMLFNPTLKYRLDYGMTADVKAHLEKVMRTVAKAKELGHISENEFKLYQVRKAYELARTFQEAPR